MHYHKQLEYAKHEYHACMYFLIRHCPLEMIFFADYEDNIKHCNYGALCAAPKVPNNHSAPAPWQPTSSNSTDPTGIFGNSTSRLAAVHVKRAHFDRRDKNMFEHVTS